MGVWGSFQALWGALLWGSTFWTQCWLFVHMHSLSMLLHSSSCCRASQVLISTAAVWSSSKLKGTDLAGGAVPHQLDLLWTHLYMDDLNLRKALTLHTDLVHIYLLSSDSEAWDSITYTCSLKACCMTKQEMTLEWVHLEAKQTCTL